MDSLECSHISDWNSHVLRNFFDYARKYLGLLNATTTKNYTIIIFYWEPQHEMYLFYIIKNGSCK